MKTYYHIFVLLFKKHKDMNTSTITIFSNIKAGNEAAFITGGNALFTITSRKSGNHFTFKVKRLRDNADAFIVLVAHNYDEYHYMAVMMKIRGRYELRNKKSPSMLNTPSCKAFTFLMNNYINDYKPHSDMIIQHEGRCGRCGRLLTDPQSIMTGFGPECAKR